MENAVHSTKIIGSGKLSQAKSSQAKSSQVIRIVSIKLFPTKNNEQNL